MKRATVAVATVFWIAFFSGASNSLRAQTALAEITGEVTDPTGSPVSQVAITLTDTATGVRTALLSNELGLYYARSLAPGTYDIQAELSGFKTLHSTGVRLATGQVLRYDFKMEIGEMTTKVQVTAQAGAVEIQKDSGEISSVLNQQAMAAMPDLTRKAQELVAITPGAVMRAKPVATTHYIAFYSLAGNPGTRGNSYYWDGTNIQGARGAGDSGDMSLVNPPTAITQEMRVITNNYSAEFGEGVGGVILMTSKAGTNSYKGELYYYAQNDALNARNFFAARNTPNHFNNFGGVFGGPIIKNKTFFLANIDQEFNIQTITNVLTLSSLAQRRGDFSQTLNAQGSLIPIFDPATTRVDPRTNNPLRDPFPGNVIPSNRFDPVASTIVNNYMVAPNAPGLITGGNNFIAKSVSLDLSRFWHFYRIDHELTANDKLFMRYSEDRNKPRTYGPFRGTNAAAADPYDDLTTAGNWTVGLGLTHIISPRTLSDFRINYGNRWYFRRATEPQFWGQNLAGKIGLKNLDPATFPSLNFAGYSPAGAGTWFEELAANTFRALTLTEVISHTRGKHSFRAGVEYKSSRVMPATRYFPSGQASFSPLNTAQPGAAATGNSMASFLLGQVASATVQDSPTPENRAWYVSPFFQDDFRVSKTLTVNLGLRYEFDTPKVDLTEGENFFNPSKINPVCNCPGVIEFGTNFFTTTHEHPPFYKKQYLRFAPRFGFAWTPFGPDFVVRGGYGIFYFDPGDGDLQQGGAYLGKAIQGDWASDAQGLTPAFVLSQGFPAIPKTPLDDAFGAVPIGNKPVLNPQFYVFDRNPAYSQQFNFGIQRQLRQNLIEIGYMGNSVKHLPYQLGVNQVTPARLAAGTAQVLRPFPQFGNITGLGAPIGISLYNAGFIQVRRNMATGLSFTASYTFARHLDNVSYSRSEYNRKLDYGPSAQEMRHRFIWASVYELPWGVGKNFLNSGPLANLIGGWRVGAIIQINSGPTLYPGSVANTCNCFNKGTQGVNLVGNPRKDTGNFDPSRDTWFNTSAFAFPAPLTFGNAAGGLVPAPRVFTVDTTLSKTWRITERVRIEPKAEFFNLLNHTNFNTPSMALGSATFGRITSAGDARKIQLGAKFFF